MRKRKLLLCAVTIAIGGATACSHNDRAPATPSASTAPSAPDMTPPAPAPTAALPSQSSSDCPMAVEGAQVTVDRMDGGVAYVFTTQSGDVAQLRDKVRKAADEIEHDQGAPLPNATPSGPTSPSNVPPVPSTSGDTSGPGGGYPPSGTAQKDQKDQNPAGLPNTSPSGAAPTPSPTQLPAGPSSGMAMHSHKMSSVPAHAVVVDVDRGARLELRPLRSEDLDALRTHAEQHASKMASGQCPTDENAG